MLTRFYPDNDGGATHCSFFVKFTEFRLQQSGSSESWIGLAKPGTMQRLGNKNMLQSADINAAACNIAREVANEGNALVCGGLSPVISYLQKKSVDEIRKEFQTQLDVFRVHDVDFILAEVINVFRFLLEKNCTKTRNCR